MTLELYLRLVITVIFQSELTSFNANLNKPLDYKTTFFFVPSLVCMDGNTFSVQINKNNACKSENGFREFGITWETAECMPNQEEPLFEGYGEEDFQVTIKKLQEVLDSHGGIDWKETLSKERMSLYI